jgi:hypothetical protein
LCSSSGATFLNSSGNTGNTTYVNAGEPIILHQVCFYIPQNESIQITEDEITDLTTSITMANNQVATEYPVFEPQTFRVIRPDDAKPTAIIDFKASATGEHTAQLDWTVNNLGQVDYFAILHSTDGSHYETIGQVPAHEANALFNSFQYFHKEAVTGTNYYKIGYVGPLRNESIVREVIFAPDPFRYSVSPNPATDHLVIEVSNPVGNYELWLYDASGKLVRQEKHDLLSRQAKWMIGELEAGIYTLRVKHENVVQSEKITILR